MVRAIPFGKLQKHGLLFEAMQFFYCFKSVQLKWIYFVVGRSSTTSNFDSFMFMHKISPGGGGVGVPLMVSTHDLY